MSDSGRDYAPKWQISRSLAPPKILVWSGEATIEFPYTDAGVDAAIAKCKELNGDDS